ncbi:hypothetical protein HAX54_023518, partial [Datura stramonium]|nr:hypothetical protein [Datura stramonium]
KKHIEEEVADYRSRCDPKGLDVTKTKKLEGIHCPMMITVTTEQLQQLNIDYTLSEHFRDLCKVEQNFEEPFDDDDAIDDTQARVDSDL